MTCIVGIAERGTVWIGADSAGSNGWFDRTIRADRKLFRKEGFIFGFCGSFRMGQLLRYQLRIPPQGNRQGIDEYMCSTFIEEVRKCLRDGGFVHKKEEVEDIDADFLVGYRGRLFTVESDFQVAEQVRNFDAIGSGANFATGALYAMAKNQTPQTRIRRALSIAEKCNAAVAAPFYVMKGTT